MGTRAKGRQDKGKCQLGPGTLTSMSGYPRPAAGWISSRGSPCGCSRSWGTCRGPRPWRPEHSNHTLVRLVIGVFTLVGLVIGVFTLVRLVIGVFTLVGLVIGVFTLVGLVIGVFTLVRLVIGVFTLVRLVTKCYLVRYKVRYQVCY